jgi:hypothetical protein
MTPEQEEEGGGGEERTQQHRREGSINLRDDVVPSMKMIKMPKMVCFILKLVFIIAGTDLHPAQPKRGQIPGELSDDGFRECRKSLRSLTPSDDLKVLSDPVHYIIKI